MENNALEALKLLGEWSKWMVSVQTGIISLIGIATASGKISFIRTEGYFGTLNATLILGALISFLVSLLAAAFLLYALPGMAQRLPPKEKNHDILMMGTLNGTGLKAVVFSALEVCCFCIGIICLVLWAAIQLFFR